MLQFPRQLRKWKRGSPIQEQEIVPVFCVCCLPEAGRMLTSAGRGFIRNGFYFQSDAKSGSVVIAVNLINFV